jgi:hypothetical protein
MIRKNRSVGVTPPQSKLLTEQELDYAASPLNRSYTCKILPGSKNKFIRHHLFAVSTAKRHYQPISSYLMTQQFLIKLSSKRRTT